MVQPQVVDYAKSQLKLGVSRENIKSALLGAGWLEADVEESLRSVMGEVFAPAQPVSPKVGEHSAVDVASIFGPKPEVGKGAGPRPAIVSDLSLGKKPEGSGVNKEKATLEDKVKKEAGEPKMANLKAFPVSSGSKGEREPGSSSFSILAAILGVVAAGAIGGAGWLYFENYNLKAEVSTLADEGGGEVSGLNSRIASLEAEAQALRADRDSLAKEFSLLAGPPGAGLAEFTGLRGTLTDGGTKPYLLTTQRGTQVSIKNSKDEAVDAALKPLVGGEVELAGTYIPGSREIAISAVNGLSVAGQ